VVATYPRSNRGASERGQTPLYAERLLFQAFRHVLGHGRTPWDGRIRFRERRGSESKVLHNTLSGKASFPVTRRTYPIAYACPGIFWRPAGAGDAHRAVLPSQYAD
jgi:hypothetical protein